MTASYRGVQWNAHKKAYDLLVALGAALYLLAFMVVGTLVHTDGRTLDPMVLAIRAFGTLSIVLLHVILCIGPLARFTTLVAPLLYNRRHLGVVTFFAALAHAGLATLYYGSFGVRVPIAAMVDGYSSFGSISGFPFEVLGLIALLVLFVMAATSHDFWLSFLGNRTWKTLHMLVYPAYAMVLLHVAMGILQAEPSTLYTMLVVAGAVIVSSLHIAAGLKARRDDTRGLIALDGWVDIGSPTAFAMNKGRVIALEDGEQVAVFRHANGLSAMSNACAHQGGPLGEGEVVGGCVTCPWHGYQYLPENGQSPPPYTEKIATYELRVDGDRVLLRVSPNEPGTHVEPVACLNRAMKEAGHDA